MAGIIKDSSIWKDEYSFKGKKATDAKLKIGIIREIKFNVGEDDIRYLVEVEQNERVIPIVCMPTTRFGGAFNFEEYTTRGYKPSNQFSDLTKLSHKAGDTVLVALLGGDGRTGVIVGSLKHPGRKRKIEKADGIHYLSEFNGLETEINNEGEWTLTFKGPATNTSALEVPPSASVLPLATYDKTIGGSFMKFYKDGSWELNDKAASDSQGIKIDKPGGITTITVGKVTVVINKNAESITTKTKSIKTIAVNKIEEKTKVFKHEATTSISMKSPKVAIGSDSIELLQQISDSLKTLITAFASMQNETHIGNLGYATLPPVNVADYVTAETELKDLRGKIEEIKGAL